MQYKKNSLGTRKFKFETGTFEYMRTYVTKHMLHFKFLNNIIWHLPLNFEKLQYCLNNTFLPLALIELTILDK